MSSQPVIDVRHVSKRYTLGTIGATSLREEIPRWWRALRPQRRGAAADAAPRAEEFWALRDVSLTVDRGDVVGIIGRNGAGKSTLLKILSRITQPTTGEIALRGRVASLLEVGTGFHPELSGRENVFLNGALLGMSKAEIRRKFDEIVAFAEVERFIDTPVKRYSSGMHVRLAFAVAAHLEPEILIVDEVLAVGDVLFQRKCLGKMGDVATRDGRTVLFVSHNMAALAAICDSALVLDAGRVAFRGRIRDGIDHYLAAVSGGRQGELRYTHDGDIDLRLETLSVRTARGELVDTISAAEPIHLRVAYEVTRPLSRVQIVCHVWTAQRVHVLATADIDCDAALFELRRPGWYEAEIVLPPLLLAPGLYELSIACGVPNQHLIDNRPGPTFEVSAMDSYAATWSGARQDVIVGLPLRWRVHQTVAAR